MSKEEPNGQAVDDLHDQSDTKASGKSGIKRNRKACTECRQQKVRCNAKVDSSEPCSRCKRMGLVCTISDPFKREHKRKRLSELERETQILKQQLQANHNQTSPSWSSSHVRTPSVSVDSSIPEPSPLMQHAPHNDSTHSKLGGIPSTIEHNENGYPLRSPAGTISRAIDGVQVPALIIDELFELYVQSGTGDYKLIKRSYFRDFHQFLPILDSTMPPNEYYEKSNLLFWTIIGVACRSYGKDPTLLDALGERILNLTLLSLTKVTIPTIKGLLLVLTWHIPKTPASHDTSYAISGSVIHMAMQIGLHIPTSAQDFSRVKVNLTETQIVRRAELWGYCIVTYQRSCSFKGHAPLALLETYQDAEQRHTLLQRISPSLRFQLRLNGVVSRCFSALLQNGLRIMSKEQEHAMEILIRVFEASLKDFEAEAVSELDKFYMLVSRLTIQTFYFYKDSSKMLPTFMVTRLYTTACSVLSLIDTMDKSNLIAIRSAPFYFFYATSISSFTILRLLKALTAQYMDENAKESLFLGIDIMKRLSTEANDAASRFSRMLTQLWTSEKAFRNADGTAQTALRIRTRLAMSAVFDAVWWWREEFGGQQGAYTLSSEYSKEPNSVPVQNDAGMVNVAPSYTPVTNMGMQDMTNFLDDHLLAELGWNNGTNMFYPPITAGSFGMDWYTQNDVNGFAI